jgi:poly(A) polymerase
MLEIKPKLLEFITEIASVLSIYEYDIYVIGGLVRDCLLGRDTSDIDIVINSDVQNMAQIVSQHIGGQYFLLDEVNNIARVIAHGQEKPFYIDFAMFKGTIEEDLSRRDFTINAMAVELNNFISGSLHLIDPFDGESDLNKKLIRAVSSQIFQDDATRLLRAVRLAAELEFKIEFSTEQLIKQWAQSVSSVSGERQRGELLRVLTLHRAGDLVHYLDDLGLLTAIIPELEQMRNVKQPKEHYWDVLEHSLQTVASVEFLLHERDWEYGTIDLLKITPWSEEIKGHFDGEIASGSNRRAMLKLGALLHDIAKPEVKTIDEAGRMRFIGHNKRGAEEAADILGRLRFSKNEIKLIKNLVYYHLRPVQMANIGLPTSRAIYRYFRDAGNDGIDILFLALADYLAARGPKISAEEWEQRNQLVNYIVDENNKQQKELLPVKLLDGHDLIEIFDLTSGPLIGKLLRLVSEAQATGEIKTKNEAVSLASEQLAKKGKA